MRTLLISINAKYIHTNNAVRLLKANCDFDVEIYEYTIKDSIKDIINEMSSIEVVNHLFDLAVISPIWSWFYRNNVYFTRCWSQKSGSKYVIVHRKKAFSKTSTSNFRHKCAWNLTSTSSKMPFSYGWSHMFSCQNRKEQLF